jgi:transcriptional regulator with XRE-family HTH domain
MPECITLGALIRQRRRELGWTQEELAERISSDDEYVRQSEISRIESGRIGLPRRERLERIADALGLPLGELLARSGWAGAEPHFGPSVPSTDLAHPAVISQSWNGSGATPTPVDERRYVPGHVPPPVAATAEPSACDADTIDAFRQALARMRKESERLHHNRLIADEMQQRLRSVSGNALDRQPSRDYSNSAGG